METKIKEILQPDETLKWSGRPQNVKLMDAPYGNSMILRIVCAAVIVLVALWLCFIGGPENMDPTNGMIFFVLCVVVGAYLVLDPIAVLNKSKNETFYAITDRRVIACYGSKKVKKVKMRTLAELDEVSVEKLANGNSMIYMGKKCKGASKMVRTQYAHTDAQDAEESRPLMFYSVEDVQGALAALPAGLCH